MSAWNILAKIIVGLIVDGEFALVPALLQQVSCEWNVDSFKLEIFSVCKTTQGKDCKFPFQYFGKTYNECMEYSGNNWCTTDSGWGICSDSCSWTFKWQITNSFELAKIHKLALIGFEIR